jgi:hypothetical protein
MNTKTLTNAMAGAGFAVAALTTQAGAKDIDLRTPPADACVIAMIDADETALRAAGGGLLDYSAADLRGMIAACEEKTGEKSTLVVGEGGITGLKIRVRNFNP